MDWKRTVRWKNRGTGIVRRQLGFTGRGARYNYMMTTAEVAGGFTRAAKAVLLCYSSEDRESFDNVDTCAASWCKTAFRTVRR